MSSALFYPPPALRSSASSCSAGTSASGVVEEKQGAALGTTAQLSSTAALLTASTAAAWCTRAVQTYSCCFSCSDFPSACCRRLRPMLSMVLRQRYWRRIPCPWSYGTVSRPTLAPILCSGLSRTLLCTGMGDNCCLPFSMGSIKSLIEAKVKGSYVVSLMIGSTPADDSYNSYFMPVHKQLDMACALVSGDENLASGFHAIGFSQGGLFVRALAQTCPGAKVMNLISIGGPQQGIFGLPECLGEAGICEEVKKLLDVGAYTPLVQNRLVQAQYWHDPRSDDYDKYNVFLPDINNHGQVKNTTYKERLLSIDKLVLVKFLNDTVVVPRDSEWFGFYVDGQDQLVAPLEQSALYTEDWLGLKTLNDQGRLVFLSCPGNHLQMPAGFFTQHILPLLTPAKGAHSDPSMTGARKTI